MPDVFSSTDPAFVHSADSFATIFAAERILVTGGLGLIGSHLARRLASFGADVLVIDSLNPNFGGNLYNLDQARGAVRVNISDVCDLHGLRFLLKDRTLIFNLAGQTSHMDSMSAPFEDLEINVKGQLSLLEACRHVNPKIRVIYASTRQVYGRPEYLPVDEKHNVRPIDVNGVNKVAGESYHMLFNDVYNIKTCVLRLTNTYGPHMRIKDARQVFLGIWVKRLLEGQPFEVWGGQQRRDFLYVADAVDAFLRAAVTPSAFGRVFNIGGSNTVSLTELAETLVDINGSGSFTVKEFPLDRKLIDIGDFYADDTLFREITGWRPVVSLTEGLRQTLAFYQGAAQEYA